jgi:hypothetical protein
MQTADLLLNLKTAKRLGLDVSDKLSALADEGVRTGTWRLGQNA